MRNPRAMNNNHSNNIRNNSGSSTTASTSSGSTVVYIEKCHENKRTLRKTKLNSGVCNSEHFRSKGNKGRRQDKMMDALGALYLLFHVSRIRSEGILLRLHVLTAALMLTFSIIVSAKQAVGNPIDCVHTRDIPVEVFNTYCWIHSTYFVTGAMLGVAGVNVAFPGVASAGFFLSKQRDHHENQQTSSRHRDDVGVKQVKYYQWVAFVLILQEN
ncbi:hypothetical protein PV325_005645 [Microctonus aethiopoides]|nr:hypothetical protein PV325_005645 [Microctonus aethiopoides]